MIVQSSLLKLSHIMAQIFISYAHGDRLDQSLAKALHDAFSRQGWTVWVDHLLQTGEHVDAFEREIDASQCVVVLWSAAARRSTWVPRELSRAVKQGKAVPVHIDEGTERPLVAENIVFSKLIAWDGHTAHPGFQQLLQTISRMLRAGVMPTEEAEPPHPGAPKAGASIRTVTLANIRALASARDAWKNAAKLQKAVESSPVDMSAQIEATLLEVVTPARDANELAVIFHALERLTPAVDRERFFLACGKWPPPRLDTDFRLIPDGRYLIGSPPDEQDRADDEHQQRVNLTSFLIASKPVTNAQFLQFIPMHPIRAWDGLSKAELDGHPAVRVTWWEAYLYCAWVGGQLPSEAQWEAACRANSTTRFGHGDHLEPQMANFNNQLPGAIRRTVPAGAIGSPNDHGLLDMHGNVWEWCADTYVEDFFAQPRPTNPVCTQHSHYRVARGGSWDDPAHAARSAFRNRLAPTSRLDNFGFRVAFSPRG